MIIKNRNKSVIYNLKLIQGINEFQAKKICDSLGISESTKGNQLRTQKEDELNRFVAKIRKIETPLSPTNETGKRILIDKFGNLNFSPIGKNFINFRKKGVNRAISINSFKGRKLKLGLPARGQRTRSNANTAKKLNRSFQT